MTDEILCVSPVVDASVLDEAGYLEANPDAAGSGARHHFAAHGRAEGRLQAVNRAKVAVMRDRKLARVQFRETPRELREAGMPIDFLPAEIVEEFQIPDRPPVSAHAYIPQIGALIRGNRDKLFLDVGAGLRHDYHANVVNTEIYASVSTDVLCVGESMPFADAQFDYVFCFATLEHTRRPWDVAAEICRVLKPGGTIVSDYPFLQPVHGYPHHYYNATPMGHRGLFERDCEICGVEIGWHHHPIAALQWTLTLFRNGLPPARAMAFENTRIGDLLDRPLESLLNAPYWRELSLEAQQATASGSLLVAVKRAPLDPAAQAGAVASGLRFAASLRPDAIPPVPGGIFGTMQDWLHAIQFRVRHLRRLPPGTRFAFLANSIRRRSGTTLP